MDLLLPVLAGYAQPEWAAEIGIVLTLFYFVWIFSWGKKALGSAKLAVLFSVIVTYLLFIIHPELVWVPVIIFFIATFGASLFDKANIFKGKE